MTEAEARDWLRECFGVPRETRVAAFLDLVKAEATRQNLIAASTLDSIWARHAVDSAQLLTLAGDTDHGGLWVDIGTGAGFPGVVIALLRDAPIVLVEPRRRRAEFLQAVLDSLGLHHASVAMSRIEAVSCGPAAIISARAVASLDALLFAARNAASRSTLWLLPKGENAQSEVAAARKAWHGSFHVEHSLTHPDSRIIIAREVTAR